MRPDRTREPERLLNDLDWFSSVCDAATAYFRGYTGLGGEDLLIIKYEQLMAQPLVELRRLAAWLGCTPGEDGLAGIWEQVAGKSLLQGVEHLWKPGANKYLGLMNRTHVPIIKSSGLADAAAAMGYEIDLATLEGLDPPEPLPDYPGWAVKKQDLDIHYWQVIGKRRTTGDEGLHVASVPAPAGLADTFGGPGHHVPTTVVTHDGELFDRVVRWLGSAGYAALRDGFEPRCKVGQEVNRDFVHRMTGR